MQYVWSYAFIICTTTIDQYVTLQSVQKLYQSDFFPKNKIGYYADNVIYMIFTETVFPFLKNSLSYETLLNGVCF